MLPHKAKATNTLNVRKTVRVAVRHEASNRNQKVVIEVADEGNGRTRHTQRKDIRAILEGADVAEVRAWARQRRPSRARSRRRCAFLSWPACQVRVTLPVYQDIQEQIHLPLAAQ